MHYIVLDQLWIEHGPVNTTRKSSPQKQMYATQVGILYILRGPLRQRSCRVRMISVRYHHLLGHIQVLRVRTRCHRAGLRTYPVDKSNISIGPGCLHRSQVHSLCTPIVQADPDIALSRKPHKPRYPGQAGCNLRDTVCTWYCLGRLRKCQQDTR